jgi:hypothetical protein
MGGMALVVLGLFVLVWIISAVVKASQDSGSRREPSPARSQPGGGQAQRVERTSNSDIDRFMAEIDRLRRRGDGAPAGRAAEPPRPAPRPVEPVRAESRVESRPRPSERRERDRDRERRPRAAARPAPPPPPPRSEPIPVLRPVAPEPPPAAPPPPPKPLRPAKPAAAATAVAIAPPSPVLQTLQSVLKGKHGPAAAIILAEIFSDPGGRPAMTRARRPH